MNRMGSVISAIVLLVVVAWFLVGRHGTEVMPSLSPTAKSISAEPARPDPGRNAGAGSLESMDVPGDAIPFGVIVPNFRSFDEAWAELLPRAESGDAYAAIHLFDWIDRCRSMLADNPTREALERKIREFPAEALGEDWERDVLRMYDGCSGTDRARFETALDWLTQAADAGSPWAQMMWYMRADDFLDLANADEETRAWYDAQSERYLESARDAGSLQAIQTILHRDMGSDPVNAYAHAAFAHRVIDDLVRDFVATGSDVHEEQRDQAILHYRQLQAQVQGTLSDLAGRLDGAGIAEAQARADLLYERCCAP